MTAAIVRIDLGVTHDEWLALEDVALAGSLSVFCTTNAHRALLRKRLLRAFSSGAGWELRLTPLGHRVGAHIAERNARLGEPPEAR